MEHLHTRDNKYANILNDQMARVDVVFRVPDDIVCTLKVWSYLIRQRLCWVPFAKEQAHLRDTRSAFLEE